MIVVEIMAVIRLCLGTYFWIKPTRGLRSTAIKKAAASQLRGTKAAYTKPRSNKNKVTAVKTLNIFFVDKSIKSNLSIFNYTTADKGKGWLEKQNMPRCITSERTTIGISDSRGV